MENNRIKSENTSQNTSQKQIAGAILLAGVLVAGAILLKSNTPAKQALQQVQDTADAANPANLGAANLDPISADDHMLGNPKANVTFIEYADYQCPFCERFYTQTESEIIKNYVNTGKINFVYRDYAFLGPESTKSAEAAECASDQGKFWEYHDYLFSHQGSENKGTFADKNLESFAATLGLNTATFNQCLESGKYTSKISTSTANGTKAGFYLTNTFTSDTKLFPYSL
jgi:protein-disulfide isomerase